MNNRIFIINPVSGTINPEFYKKLIIDLMKEYKPEEKYSINETEKPNDITRIVEENISRTEENILYIIGGDGTLNESVYAVIKNRLRFIPIPAGTGNDFSKTVYKEKMSAQEIIIKSFDEKYETIDIMTTSISKYALNVINFGFDAQVADNVKYFRRLPFVSGQFKYNLSIVVTLLFNRNYRFKIRIDGVEQKGSYTLCAVGKGKYYGGGVKVLPYAKLNNNKLAVCLVKKTSILDKIKLLPKFKKGQHSELKKYLEVYQCETFTICSNKKFPLAIDGEIYNMNRFRIDTLKDMVSIIKV